MCEINDDCAPGHLGRALARERQACVASGPRVTYSGCSPNTVVIRTMRARPIGANEMDVVAAPSAAILARALRTVACRNANTTMMARTCQLRLFLCLAVLAPMPSSDVDQACNDVCQLMMLFSSVFSDRVQMLRCGPMAGKHGWCRGMRDQ
jgi:hypothetical protein